MFRVGQAVRVTAAIDYGAGTSHWDGVVGVVKTARERSCDVQVGDDLIWFFNRELTEVSEDARVSA
jgi:ribosomal protein L21E